MPLLPAALLLAALLLPLAHPGRLLMVRDLAFFHLPLRQVVVELVRHGELPEWNRWIHGGQPILSNPNYAAFYPPAWLGIVLPLPYALNLLVLAHAAWALVGSWRLLRRLGAGSEAAALGAMGFAASSWFLSLTSTFNFFCSMAWFPWALAAGEEALAVPRHGRWGRAAFATAACLALELLAGEPVTVLVTGLALAALALGGVERLRRTVPRLLAIALCAGAIGAVQLVPTMHRLAGSSRGEGIPAAEANRWSTPPARLVDFVLPRFWGDAQRDEEGLWFGWGLHDRDFPYVVALYSSLLLTVLALAALLRWPIPYRGAWAGAAIVGILLALGRHNPLWEPLRRSVPLLAVVRYPEKFTILTAAMVPIAGALGWHHLLAARDRGERSWPLLPAALAGIVTGVAGLFAVLLAARPDVGEAFIRNHSGLPPSPRTLATGLAFLRTEALAAVILAAAVTGLLAITATTRLSRRTLAVAAVAVVAADLWWYGRGLEPTLPAGEFLSPPPIVASARAAGGRLLSGPALDQRPEIGLRQGPPGFQQLWGRVLRLDPYVGTLWGIEYALHPDYDLMLTRWGRHALAEIRSAWPQRAPVDRLLGAWDVGALVLRRDPRELMLELQRTRRIPVSYLVMPIRERLHRFRFIAELGHVADEVAATQALDRLDLGRADLCIGDGGPPAGRYASATLLDASGDQRLRVTYRAGGAAFMVAAITFDESWGATLEDGTALPTCPTALGQLGVALPAGEHRVHLVYRDAWVRVGAAITAITLLAMALAALRRRGAAAEPLA